MQLILTWLWEKIPWYIMFPVGLVMTPIALVVVVLWYSLFLPWQTTQIEATVLSHNEMRDLRYESMLEKQTLINNQVKESLDRIDKRQEVMFEYIVKHQK